MIKINDNSWTDTECWNNFWERVTLPALVDPRVQWQIALANEFRRNLPQCRSLKLFEVGCAPGRWLVWFHQELGYQVSGCDTSAHGLHLTLENLRLKNVQGEIYQADILSGSLPKHVFDVVLSIGFIEHFEDPKPVIIRHLDLLKPGGTLVLEVPNMAGWINHRLLRIAGMHDFFSFHNLNVMNRAYFQSIAHEFCLDVKFLGYVGGFDPGLVVYNYPYEVRGTQGVYGKYEVFLELWRKKHFIVPILWLLQHLTSISPNLFTRFNASFWSNMLLGIYRVPQ